MTRTLLCFGDSNTHGSPPLQRLGEPYRRYDAATRWPRVALAHLGDGWDLIEEGLPGRTAQFADPTMGAHMDGREGLRIALQSHGPIDVLTLMLGTNDTKTMFGATPEAIMAGVASLLMIALSDEVQARHGGFKVLVISPPKVVETGCLAAMFWGGAAKSQALPLLYAGLAAARGVGFLDAAQVVAVSPVDGVHLEPGGHIALGAAVARSVVRLTGA